MIPGAFAAKGTPSAIKPPSVFYSVNEVRVLFNVPADAIAFRFKNVGSMQSEFLFSVVGPWVKRYEAKLGGVL